MKNFRITVFCSFIVLITSLNAQTIPDYKERTFAAISDSLKQTQNYFIEATEGVIDPEEYIVGPGDKLFISIAGMEDINLNLIINQEGNLFIPKVGGISLKNINLAGAKEKITASINKYYKNVDVFISLMDFRKIKVSLLGDVKKPSSYILSGNSRLIDLIMNSQGLNETSNYRNISIINKEKDTSYYDFLSFLRFGKVSGNPLLREGDLVIVDRADRIVAIHGLIKYPGIYEYVEGEKISELIQLAGGFLSRARTDTIEVVTFKEDGKTQVSNYYSIEDLKDDELKLHHKDQVLVREIPEFLIERFVRISGFVKYPGYYKIKKDETTLIQIIEEAGGFRENASLNEATLYRTTGTDDFDPEFERLKLIDRNDLTDDEYDYLKAKSRQRPGSVVVNFVNLFEKGDLSENVILKRNDEITIPEAKNYIILLGQVVNPGNIIYNKDYTVDDYLQLAGGFSWRALKGDVRVVKAKTGEWVDADDVDSLEPGDTIWIPEDPPPPRFWDVFTTSLAVVGQVASIIAATVAVIVASR